MRAGFARGRTGKEARQRTSRWRHPHLCLGSELTRKGFYVCVSGLAEHCQRTELESAKSTAASALRLYSLIQLCVLPLLGVSQLHFLSPGECV